MPLCIYSDPCCQNSDSFFSIQFDSDISAGRLGYHSPFHIPAVDYLNPESAAVLRKMDDRDPATL